MGREIKQGSNFPLVKWRTFFEFPSQKQRKHEFAEADTASFPVLVAARFSGQL